MYYAPNELYRSCMCILLKTVFELVERQVYSRAKEFSIYFIFLYGNNRIFILAIRFPPAAAPAAAWRFKGKAPSVARISFSILLEYMIILFLCKHFSSRLKGRWKIAHGTFTVQILYRKNVNGNP